MRLIEEENITIIISIIAIESISNNAALEVTSRRIITFTEHQYLNRFISASFNEDGVFANGSNAFLFAVVAGLELKPALATCPGGLKAAILLFAGVELKVRFV